MVAYVLALPTPSTGGGACGAVTGGAATAVVMALVVSESAVEEKGQVMRGVSQNAGESPLHYVSKDALS
jgi:hypothetical protein